MYMFLLASLHSKLALVTRYVFTQKSLHVVWIINCQCNILQLWTMQYCNTKPILILYMTKRPIVIQNGTL